MNIEVYSGKKIENVLKEINDKHSGNFTIIEQTQKRRFLFGTTYIVRILVSEDKKIKNKLEKAETTSEKNEILEMLMQETNNSKEVYTQPIKNNNIYKNENNGIKEIEVKSVESISEIASKIVTTDKEIEKNTYLRELMDKLIYEEEVEKSTAERIISEVRMTIKQENWNDKNLIDGQTIKLMEKMLPTFGSFESDDIRTIALVGPTGVGKTTTLAKITAILKQNGKKIGLISTDVYRIGAIEQLQTYADIMESKMIEARNPQELKEAIEYFRHVEKVDIIMIDTVGRSAMRLDSIEGIKEYMDISNPDHTALVLSSTQKYRDMERILNNFESVKVDSLIFTKLDETISYGFILNILKKYNVKVSYVTNGQNVPQDIIPATSEYLAKQIVIGDEENGSSVVTA